MSLIQGELWFRGISFGPSGVQVCSDCCVGHALFQRGALAVLESMENTGTAQAQPSLSQMCWEVFIMSAFWCPSVETVASQHLPGTGWLPVWRHLFLLRTWEEAKVLVWPLMDTWSRVRGSLPLVIENRGSAVRPTHWSQVLGGEELLWGSLGYHCPGGDGRCPAALLKWREP